WPVPAGAATAFTSWLEMVPPVEPVDPVAAAAPSVGADGSADGVGVAVGVVGDATAAGCGRDDGFPLLSDIIVCTAYAIASARTTPSTIAIFFCFSAFALAASATFLRAISSPLL